MKITENINMKSAYAGLDTVRGYMPSADTVKSWTIEPIKSTWSKPAGKAVFIAAAVIGTLAIAYTAVKAVRWVNQNLDFMENFKDKSIKQLNEMVFNENRCMSSTGRDGFIVVGVMATLAIACRAVRLISGLLQKRAEPNIEQSKLYSEYLYSEYQEMISGNSIKELESCLENQSKQFATFDEDQKKMFSALSNLLKIKLDYQPMLDYDEYLKPLGTKEVADQQQYNNTYESSKNFSLEKLIRVFNTTKASGTELSSSLKALQARIAEKVFKLKSQ